MKALGIIIQREYSAMVKTKAFMITTILMPIVMAVMVGLPTVLQKLGNDDIKKVYVLDHTNQYFSLFESSEKFQFESLTDEAQFPKKDEKSGEMYALLSIDAELSEKPAAATFFSEKQQPPRELTQYINDVLTSAVKRKKLTDYTDHANIDVQIADSLQSIINAKESIKINTKQWDEDGKEKDTANEMASMVGMAFTFLMFFFIIMNGSMVMQSVVEEKTNRIVEVIVSSTKPFNLMMGKIIAVALSGLTQLLIWGIIGVIGMNIAGSVMGAQMSSADMSMMAAGGGDMQELMASMNSASGDAISNIITSINWVKVLLCFVIYFIGGYLLYASLFAMFGSAANDSQEAQQFIMPVTILLLLSFYVGFAAARNPEGSLAFWGSIIPFTSPVVMMVRLPLEVPIWEIILSIALLFVTSILSIMLAGKIYRTGILMYGKKVSFKEIFKWIRYK